MEHPYGKVLTWSNQEPTIKKNRVTRQPNLKGPLTAKVSNTFFPNKKVFSSTCVHPESVLPKARTEIPFSPCFHSETSTQIN